MKKSLCLILVAILLCSSLMLVACNEETDDVPEKEMHTITIIILNSGGGSVSFEVEHGRVIGDFSKYTNHSYYLVTRNNFYTDATCTNKWDLYHDLVLSDVTLFAKKIG